MAGQRVEIEALTDQRGKAIDRPAQVGRSGRDVDADRWGDRQHDDRSAVTAARARSGDASAGMKSRSPLASCSSRPARADAGSDATTCTGANATVVGGGVARACRFQ